MRPGWSSAPTCPAVACGRCCWWRRSRCPSFVNAFGWISIAPRLDGYTGAVLITTLSYFPLVYLPAAAALRGLDPGLEESAYSLGLGRWRDFVRVVLPQLRPALLGGALLVSLHLLSEFGALALLRYPTFTTAIYDQFQSSFNSSAATMLAGVLVLLCLALLLADLGLRGRSRYARLGGGAPRPVARAPLGPAVLAGAGRADRAGRARARGADRLDRALAARRQLDRHRHAPLLQATGTSLSLGAVAAAVTVLLAIPAAWLAVRHRGRVSALLERSTYISSALPGIVVALALVTISIRAARPLYQTAPLLIAGYAILFIPRAVVTARAALAQAPPVLDSVARSLGEGTIGTLRRVTLPLIAPGLGAGAALVFLAVVTELTATLLLSPLGTRDAGHGVLEPEQQPRVRGGRAVRGAAGGSCPRPRRTCSPGKREGRPHDGTHPLRRHQGVRLHRRCCAGSTCTCRRAR